MNQSPHLEIDKEQPNPRRISRGAGFALFGASIVILCALAWAFVPRTGRAPIVSAVSAPQGPTQTRLALAEKVAFPGGLFGQSAHGSRIVYKHGQIVDTPFGPVLVNEGSIPDAAHVESGSVSVIYLAAIGKGFRVVRKFPFAVESGSFGSLTEFHISNDFSTLPVISTQGGGMWQGYSGSWTTLTELRPEGPVELVTFQDGYDNSGAVEKGAQSSEGQIRNIKRGRSFVVHFSGSHNFDAKYVRVGNAYQLQGGDKYKLPEV